MTSRSSTGRKAVFTVALLAALVAPPLGAQAAAANVVALGCSVTHETIVGYRLLGGSRFADGTGGGATIEALSNLNSVKWRKFTTLLGRTNETAVYWQACGRTGDPTGEAAYLDAVVIVSHIDTLTAAPIYLGWQPEYSPTSCSTEQGPVIARAAVQRLVLEGYGLADPGSPYGPLTTPMLESDCRHQSPLGEAFTGAQLLTAWG